MKPRSKSHATRPSKSKTPATGTYEVPSHGRLARRGSTEVVEDIDRVPRGNRDRPDPA
jgi:hypothetical protein